MLTRNDCLLLLSEISNEGIDTSSIIRKLLNTNTIDKDVLKFITDHRDLSVAKFYERLRESYKTKRSKLYKEIVQIDEKEPKDIVVTLSSLLLQILLYSNMVSDRVTFLKHARAEEIAKVLQHYLKDFDSRLCFSILLLVKADLKAFEEARS